MVRDCKNALSRPVAAVLSTILVAALWLPTVKPASAAPDRPLMVTFSVRDGAGPILM